MSAQLVKGTSQPFETAVAKTKANKNGYTVEVEGPYSLVEVLDASSYCPAGYEVESSEVTTLEDGFGRLTVRCIEYSSGDSGSWSPVRTTFKVDMAETSYELQDHPSITAVPNAVLQVACWLATDEAKRVEGSGANITYKYTDKSGALQTVDEAFAIKFCAAYRAGIKTFNRYYPVIEKISTWKNPPGLARSGTSFSSGSPTFSANIGQYNAPPITLNGFASTNWFKSKDSWVENSDKTWNRVEQWTYTPESSSGSHAWIYA